MRAFEKILGDSKLRLLYFHPETRIKMPLGLTLVAVLAGLAGVALGGHPPPLASLPQDFYESEDAELNPATFFNVGLEGAVTQEDWDRATVKDAPAPNVTIHDFMGCGDRDVTIIGKTMKTIKEREIYAFFGIRFGEPPVKDLRFKKTVPAGPYFGEIDTLEAVHMGPKCPQMSMMGPIPSGDEDCLYLNVYTPYLPSEGKEPLPVMMWIYGGAFISGDASLYMPTRLLDKDIILVVIQYRLGSLGWFSLQNENAPGNAGLWDQIEALNWIQENIEGFGGDPNRVTIAGESAGSASVNYLLLLGNETRGLFQGVIAESGSALDHWSLDPNPEISAKLIGRNNSCNTDDLQQLYECMRDTPADQLTTVISSFVSEDRKNKQMGFRGAAPVIQKKDLNGTLITKHPREYYWDGDTNDVPLLIGANKHEGAFVFGIMYWEFLIPNHKLDDPEYLREYMMGDLTGTFGINDPSNGIGEALKDDYVGGRDLADFENATPGLVDLAGMLFLKAGAWETAKRHAANTTSNTFVYSFDFESDDSLFKVFFSDYKNAPFKSGVCHADELLYLFSLPAYLDAQQLIVKDRLVTMWTNFVIHGDPTPDEDKPSWMDLNIPKWEPLLTGDHHFMLIEGECSLQQEYPDRWHISLDDDEALHSTLPPTTTVDPDLPTKEEYDQVNHERTVFMGCMIAFVITTAILGCLSAYFFFKHR